MTIAIACGEIGSYQRHLIRVAGKVKGING